jgi:hypothetical protein
MPDKPPAMRVQYKKVEKQERSRLEAILIDSTKSEADRDFARERLQAIREAAVTRAKVRAARRADYVEPEPAEENPVVEDDYPPKPTLEECDGDEDLLRDETELWQIELNDRAARRVLDSPKSSLLHRQNAERTLRKGAQRRHEIYPTIYGLAGERVSDSTTSADTEPEHSGSWRCGLFKSRHAKGTAAYTQEYEQWMQKHRLADEEERTKLRRENPEEYERQLQADREAERKRLEGVVSVDHLGRPLDSQGRVIGPRARSSVPTNDDGSFIASLLQEKVWGEQSREFARLRGEIVDEPTPIVVTPNRTTAYRLSLDGFLFWPDNTPCESPLPAGTRIVSAPTPPYYRANDRSIPAGLKFDAINFIWVSVQ